MSEPSKTDPFLALLAELDEGTRRIAAKADDMGELSITITGTKLLARIDRLRAKLSRERDEEQDNGPGVVLHLPKMSAEQQNALDNAVTIDLPRVSRRPRIR